MLKALKILHHLKGKLKDGKIVATEGYAENSLAMSVFLMNSTNFHFNLHLYTSCTSLLLCKYITVLLYCIIYGLL